MLVRVTTLEQFRRFIQDVDMYATEEALLESITGGFQGNEYTRIGTAFHKLVECGDISVPDFYDNRVVFIEDYEITFSQRQVEIVMQYREEIKGCFHEIRHHKDYEVNGRVITMLGGLDVLLGLKIRDIKTKYSYIKTEEVYTDSFQWRLYCDIFEVPLFTYDVFIFEGYNREKDQYDVSKLNLVRHDPIECCSYPTMQSDIQKLLEQFLDYVQFRKLEAYFPDSYEKQGIVEN